MAECNTTMIYIDSKDRNQRAYPNPNSYVYKLDTAIRNAHTIEIMMFQMTKTDPAINSSNAAFQVVVGSTTYNCSLTHGEIADPADLANNLQGALRAGTGNNNNWYVAASNTGFLTISFNYDFSIIVSSSASILLGLQGKTTASGGELTGLERGAGKIVSTYISTSGSGVHLYQMFADKQADIDGDPYVLLFVNDYHPCVSANSFMSTAFMVIPLENTTLNTRFLISNDLKEKKNVYVLGPSQSRIDNIRISITRPDGSPYLTNGIDHQIVFRVKRKDNASFTS